MEKLLALHELLTPNSFNISSVLKSCSSSTGNIVATAKGIENECEESNYGETSEVNISSSSPTNQQNTRVNNEKKNKALTLQNYSSTTLLDPFNSHQQLKPNQQHNSQKTLVTQDSSFATHQSSPSSLVCTPTSSYTPSNCTMANNTSHPNDNTSKLSSSATTSNINSSAILQTGHSSTKSCINNYSISNQYKGWYIQPACAITGEGLQEGLEALYDMILKRRKFQKIHKKRR